MRDFSNHATVCPDGHDIAVTDIETCVIGGNFEWNLVKVHPDAGITGTDEAYRGGVSGS